MSAPMDRLLEAINAALSAVLWCESRALRVMDLPVGSSLLCVARKPGE